MRDLLSIILVFSGITGLMFIVIFMFRYAWVKPSKIRSRIVNSSLCLFSIAYSLLIAELSLRTLLLHSDGGNKTLVSQQWHKKYWVPINSEGYRDYEHDWRKPVLFIVGDSFIAGHGINDIDKRLSTILSNHLNDTWSVATIAKNGWNTAHQYDGLTKHHIKPNKVVISYYINDIVNAARQHGLVKVSKNIHTTDQSTLTKYLNKHSFLFNWFYLNLIQPSIAHIHDDYFKRAFRDPKIWNTHTNEINKIIKYANERNINLSFLIWPKLTDLSNSREFTDKVEDFLIKKNVTVINLSNVFDGRSTNSLIVNKWDGHPNKKTNQEVAEILYKQLNNWH